MTMHPFPAALAALAIAVGACAGGNDATADSAMPGIPAAGTGTSSAAGATVEVATDSRWGSYLTDASGRALYMFEKDPRGESTCDSACAAAWPPFVTQGAPAAGDTAVNATMLSTIQRADGSQQVAYNGMPLYYFARDTGPGQTKGQDIEGFGAEWYLVAPDGTKQEGEEHEG